MGLRTAKSAGPYFAAAERNVHGSWFTKHGWMRLAQGHGPLRPTGASLAATLRGEYNRHYMSEKAKKPPSFEEGLEELEKIVKELESGDLPLEKSLRLFEKGVKLTQACRKQLQEAEGKVEILLKKEGRVEGKPFEIEDGEQEA